MINDIQLERFVLGTFLSEKDSFTDHAHLLFPEMWYQDGHRVIYEAIRTLANKNAPIDIISGTNELKRIGQLDYVGGAEYITDLIYNIFLPESLEYHIRVLTEFYIKRELFAFGQKVSKDANDQTKDIFESINEIENRVSVINSKIIGNESDNDLAKSIKITYDHLMTPRESRCTGLNTGNGALTDILGGFNPELYLLCGRPSMGKSTRMIQFAAHIAEQGEPVAVFSLEMTQEHQVNTKLLNYFSEVDSGIINSQSCNEKERKAMAWAAERISKLPIYIDDESHISPNYIRTIARQLKKKKGLSMIFIDYIQQMKPNEFIKSRNRDLEMGDIMGSLKAMVKDLKIPVMVLSQLSRSLEDRTDKHPQMRDLRESGNLEQDADVIMSVFRPGYYDASADEMICELSVMKHRMGAAKINITEYFEKSKSKFHLNKPHVHTV